MFVVYVSAYPQKKFKERIREHLPVSTICHVRPDGNVELRKSDFLISDHRASAKVRKSDIVVFDPASNWTDEITRLYSLARFLKKDVKALVRGELINI